MMPPERNFLFIFSVLAGTVFSLSHMIFCLIPPPTCQGHGLNICVVLRGRRLHSAPRHCRQRCSTGFSQQQLSIFLQDHTVLCSLLLMGRHLSRGSWPGLGSCWKQPPSVSMTWASLCHCCNVCLAGVIRQTFALCKKKFPGSFWLFLMCMSLYFDVPDAAKGLGLRVRPAPPPRTGIDGQVICTESLLLFLLVRLMAKTLLFILLLIPADAETTFNFQPGSHPAMGRGHLCSTPRRDV